MLPDTRSAYLYIAHCFYINHSDFALQAHLNCILRVIIDARPPFYAFRPNGKQERAHFSSSSLNACVFVLLSHSSVCVHTHSCVFIYTLVLVRADLSVWCIYYHADMDYITAAQYCTKVDASLCLLGFVVLIAVTSVCVIPNRVRHCFC